MLVYLDTCIGFAVVMLVISLMITILTQMASALVNHRGSNLLWGVKTIFANIDPRRFPQLSEKAEAIAREALTHCLVSDSWFSGNVFAQGLAARIPVLQRLFERFQLASSIRPGELRSILAHLAENKFADTAVAQELRILLGTGQAAGGAQASAVASALSPTIQGVQIASAHIAGNLEGWFDSMMDRVSQKFTMYMRIWTVVFAAAIALGAGLSASRLWSDLYTNGAFRNALVGAGQAALTSAGRVLESKNTLGVSHSAALAAALRDAGVANAPPPIVPSPAAAAAWIAENVPASRQLDVQRRFDGESIEASRAFIQRSIEDATKVSAVASSAGFDLAESRWPQHPSLRDVLGVFLTIGLLSLGAPFWFNALKSLTNLRSTVAEKDDERGASKPQA